MIYGFFVVIGDASDCTEGLLQMAVERALRGAFLALVSSCWIPVISILYSDNVFLIELVGL